MFVLMLAAGMSAPLLAHEGHDQVTVEKSAVALPGSRYAWVTSPATTAAEQDERVSTPQFREKMQAALDAELKAKGYQLVGASEADVLIAYRAGVRDVQQPVVHDYGSADTRQASLECTSDGCSQLVTRNGNGEPVLKVKSSDEIQAGLMVEVIDRTSLRVVWRAMDEGTAKANRASRVSLDRVAREILVELPRAPATP
ncbi:hypothetical protein ABB29_01800 [Pseudoxanthomonas dokdonensis]|uniref:DUF4136 domain-containing protein n=1 Tax=Pseudoxanthomonas dokdonensis TaxID=344882 RepID=A0A0R0CNE4_9GAMM|nr:hypothetical protein ABB29_01800 [Pseudoxanthomonas dokdonensis]